MEEWTLRSISILWIILLWMDPFLAIRIRFFSSNGSSFCLRYVCWFCKIEKKGKNVVHFSSRYSMYSYQWLISEIPKHAILGFEFCSKFPAPMWTLLEHLWLYNLLNFLQYGWISRVQFCGSGLLWYMWWPSILNIADWWKNWFLLLTYFIFCPMIKWILSDAALIFFIFSSYLYFFGYFSSLAALLFSMNVSAVSFF